MKSHLPLSDANLLTPVLLWEGASHTQFNTQNSHGTVGSSWVWAELLEASPSRSNQSLIHLESVSLSVRLVCSTIPELWGLYAVCSFYLIFRVYIPVELSQLLGPGRCLILYWLGTRIWGLFLEADIRPLHLLFQFRWGRPPSILRRYIPWPVNNNSVCRFSSQ